MVRFVAIVVALQCTIAFSSFSQEKQQVALELVLAIDTSTSVDEREFQLQKLGLASAFRHPGIVRSLENLGRGGAAIAVVQWAGPQKQILAVDWQNLTDSISSERMAQSIERMKRVFTGFTEIGNAIAFSTAAIEGNGFAGERRVIDVSGDGVSDQNDPAPFRSLAVARGMTVNGLIIYSNEYDLGELARIELHDHYTNQVIGGTGAFLIEADSFDDFAEAIRRKLLREIAGANVAGLQHRYSALSDNVWAR